MALAEARQVWRGDCALVCGLAWLPGAKVLLSCDPQGGRILAFDPASGAIRGIHVGGRPSLVYPASNGKLLFARDRELMLLSSDSEIEREIAIDTPPHSRTLVGTVDVLGRLWFGMEEQDGSPSNSGLWRYHDERMVPMLFDRARPGGVALNLDARTLFLVVASTRTIERHDVNRAGALSNRASVVTLGANEAEPCGLALDCEGSLWVAMRSDRVRRYSVEGECLQEIVVPEGRPFDLAFGGEDLTTLFVTATLEDGTSVLHAIDSPVAGQPIPPVKLTRGARLGLVEDDDH